ncbi:hypothetical protein GYMLUDRAFT_1023737, partial [Collybiopsis luxurians FD-317 M1]
MINTGLLTLHRYTSTSASYNAGARYPPPLCHSGTHEAILNDLESWANSAEGQDNPGIRWLYRPAGAGKSAIAQTFAQKCADDQTLVGSFFFRRSDPTRNNSQRLFATIALQMAIAIPHLRVLVDAAVTRNLFAPTSSIEQQSDALVIQPINESVPESSRRSTPIRTRILIIDGLDECSNDRNKWHSILFILAKMVQEYQLPLQILVCSRPELRIKECFRGSEFRGICQWMSLDDTYQASQDIRLFLMDGFKGILARHTHSMQHVTSPWPTLERIEYLVQKSSGHFIFPSTVLKYIDDDNDIPTDCLDVVLGLQVVDQEGGNSPFADLDALYLQILS